MRVIAKQKKSHKLILKIHSSRLAKANWDLKLPLSEALKNKNDIVALGDSQTLRFLDKINGVYDFEEKTNQYKKEIKELRRMPTTRETKKQIKDLYNKLYEAQFQSDYICVIMDSTDEFDRANMDFKLNGITYTMLLGTNGGIKKSTIIYYNKDKYNLLDEKLENGRNKRVKLVPAKYGAYKALACSGSIVVTPPKNVIVVDDCETQFKQDVIHLSDTDENGAYYKEPYKKLIKDAECKLTDSDGYGFMSPAYSKIINGDLYGDYENTISGINSRCFSWSKGMLFTFDYVDFADKVTRKQKCLSQDDDSVYFITDIWGDKRDVREADIILTGSMLKLWNCYDSLEDYMQNCTENEYDFGVAKTCPHVLENVRYSNYQFIQTYNLNEEDLYSLCKPTIDEINDILGMDYEKSILYLTGLGMTDTTVDYLDNDFIKALMIDKRMINDPFVRNKIHNMIKKKINEAKIAKLKLDGNFQIISGDLYSLAQSMFGLKVTGLLKAGEVYSKYWIDKDEDEIILFRAPMTSRYNIRKVKLGNTEDMQYWYRYVKTAMILNSWDTICDALNGADKDSDTFFSTNNEILKRNTVNLPAIQCIQRIAEKKTCTRKQMIRAYKLGFGDEVGTTTNHITSMIERQAGFEVGSKEYEVLDYRIMCGQLYQQNSIDKCKGIIAKPMPKYWYKLKNNKIKSDDNELQIKEKKFNKNICAYRKPYFMRYIYPQEDKKLKEYIDNNNRNCMRLYRLRLNDLLELGERTNEQAEFIENYYKYMPLGCNPCTVNKICWLFEKEFDTYKSTDTVDIFDHKLLMNDSITYTKSIYKEIERVYKQYTKQLSDFAILSKEEKLDKDEVLINKDQFKENFIRECSEICPNKLQLCNIVVDMCYKTNKSKQFAWDICGDTIIENLLMKNNGTITYFTRCEDGNIEFNGERFTREQKIVSSYEEVELSEDTYVYN